MHKEGLELSLGEVQYAHEKCKLLQLRSRCVGAVDVWAGQVHERVDEKGAEIFDDEDSSPGDLGTCIG